MSPVLRSSPVVLCALLAALAACAPDDSPVVKRASAAETPAATAPTAPRRVRIGDVDLTGIGYDLGSPSAPIVIVDFSDFGCPYCGQHARETLPALENDYIATGKVFYKAVPFVMGMFPNGQQAARAAECAADQGRFWPMHDRLFATQQEWKRSPAPFQLFQRAAAALGLDAKQFSACYTGQATDARTARATDGAERLGIRATPTFFVNGRPIEGALPLPRFRELIAQLAP